MRLLVLGTTFVATIILILLLVFFTSKPSSSGFKLRTKAAINATDEAPLVCRVQVTAISLADGNDEELLECVLLSTKEQEDENFYQDSTGYEIDLPLEIVATNEQAIMQGSLYLSIPGGFLEKEHVDGFGAIGTRIAIPERNSIDVLDPAQMGETLHRQRRHRHLQSPSDIRDVIVFRVSTEDAEPDAGPRTIEKRIFASDEFSFVSHYDSCSFGQSMFEPSNTTNPVIDIAIPGTVDSYTGRTILHAASAVVKDVMGKDASDLADHAIFCMPAGTGGKGYLAYSGVNSYFSVYNNRRCTFPTTVMHEIGHNLGLGHANDGLEYGDETTLMGFSSSRVDGPQKCFNGQNIHHLGWFRDRSTTVDPSTETQVVKLATFVDYDITSPDEFVLISVADIHLVYNRAKGFNSETHEYIDQVTLVQEVGINSVFLGSIDSLNPIYTLEDFNGETLYVEVCDTVTSTATTPDYVILTIGLNSGGCASISSSPSSAPSRRATRSPTFPELPIESPTDAPTAVSNDISDVQGGIVRPEIPLSTNTPNATFVLDDNGAFDTQSEDLVPEEEDDFDDPPQPEVEPTKATSQEGQPKNKNIDPLVIYFSALISGGMCIAFIFICCCIPARSPYDKDYDYEGQTANESLTQDGSFLSDADVLRSFQANQWVGENKENDMIVCDQFLTPWIDEDIVETFEIPKWVPTTDICFGDSEENFYLG